MTVTTTRSDGGVAFRLDLDSDTLLPGRVATGCVRSSSGRDRGPRDHRQPDRHRDCGRRRKPTATRMATTPDEDRDVDRGAAARCPSMLGRTGVVCCRREPGVLVGDPGAAARARATFEATVAGLTVAVEVKLDVPGFDPDVTADVVVLQPTALLRAGVVDVAQFALFPSADVVNDAPRLDRPGPGAALPGCAVRGHLCRSRPGAKAPGSAPGAADAGRGDGASREGRGDHALDGPDGGRGRVRRGRRGAAFDGSCRPAGCRRCASRTAAPTRRST